MNDRDKLIESLNKLAINPTSSQVAACDTYINNLAKWQKKINLVGASTLDVPYTRHILDAAQLVPRVPRGTLLDVGSGAGIPGLILSIFLDNQITLCERNTKKTSFLNDMVRKLNLQEKCHIISKNVEGINQNYDIITGRGVTNLSNFLYLTYQQRHHATLYIVQKGKSVCEELEAAQNHWQFSSKIVNSIVNSDSNILFLSNVEKK